MLNLASKKLQKHSQYFSPSYRKRSYWNRLINCSQLRPFWENFKNARYQNTPIDTSRVNQWTRISCLSDVLPSSCWQSSLNQFSEWSSCHSNNYLTDNASNLEDSCFVSTSFQLLQKKNKTSKFSFQLMCKERCWICLNILSPKIYSSSSFNSVLSIFQANLELLGSVPFITPYKHSLEHIYLWLNSRWIKKEDPVGWQKKNTPQSIERRWNEKVSSGF